MGSFRKNVKGVQHERSAEMPAAGRSGMSWCRGRVAGLDVVSIVICVHLHVPCWPSQGGILELPDVRTAVAALAHRVHVLSPARGGAARDADLQPSSGADWSENLAVLAFGFRLRRRASCRGTPLGAARNRPDNPDTQPQSAA